VGCSLHSLSRLDRCAGKPVSSDCPAAGSVGGSAAEGGALISGNGGELVMPLAGSGGAPGGAGAFADAGAAGATESSGLIVLYADHSGNDPSMASKAIRPIFVIENLGNAPVPLSELSLRYYYTLEAEKTQIFECDYVSRDAVVNDCAGVVGTFGRLDSGQATHFVEVTFIPPGGADWSLAPLGGQSGTIILRFYKDHFETQNQTNDYSFDPTKAEIPAEWDHVTLYRVGVLVFGVEPG
jgi:hypothetical protein